MKFINYLHSKFNGFITFWGGTFVILYKAWQFFNENISTIWYEQSQYTNVTDMVTNPIYTRHS